MDRRMTFKTYRNNVKPMFFGIAFPVVVLFSLLCIFSRTIMAFLRFGAWQFAIPNRITYGIPCFLAFRESNSMTGTSFTIHLCSFFGFLIFYHFYQTATFTMRCMPVFFAFISMELRQWFNLIALRTLFCYDLLSHCFSPVKVMVRAVCGLRPTDGSFYYNKLSTIVILIFALSTISFGQQKAFKNISSFNSGELSPLVKAREDLSKFHAGCETMENMIPLPQGAAQKRPGTVYVAESKSNTKIRLLPFEYSTEQAYIIEAGNQYMRFFTDNDVIYKPYGTETLTSLSSYIVAHYKCDDNAATTVVVDADGATYNGVASVNTNTAGFSISNEEATANSAFDLADSRYFTIADAAAFSFGDGTSDEPFSVALWFRYEDDGGTQTIISKRKAASDKEYQILIGSTAQVQVTFTDDSSTGTFTTTSADVVTEGWHYFVVTYDGVGGTGAGAELIEDSVSVYIDWTEMSMGASSLASYTAMEDLTAKVCVGGNNEGAANLWVGDVDNVAFFNKELTRSEIAALQGNDSTTSYEISTPYLTADLFEIKYEQSADVLYITHPDYEPRELSRYGNASWYLDPMDIRTGPFLDENTDVSRTITPSGVTGQINLTAVGHSPFVDGVTAGHEASDTTPDWLDKAYTGALLKFVQPLATGAYEEILSNNYTADQTEDVSWMDCGSIAKGVTWYLTTLGTWTGTLEVQRNYTIGAAHGAASWETVFTYQSTDDRNASTNAEETVDDADYRVILTASGDAAEPCQVYFRISDTDHVGIVEITSVTSPQAAVGMVRKTLAGTSATHRWSEGSWSNYRGWPRTVTFFEDRLTFGGNSNQPDTIWLSQTGDYGNMEAGANDDEAMAFTLSSRQVNVIEWIIGKNKLLIGTSGAEWTLEGGNEEPLTPSSVKAEQHSTYGSANLQATLASESVLFFQRGAEKMRELAYNWETDAYVAPDMTLLVPEVTGDGITDVAYQKTPNSILYCVKENGDLAVFVYERKELITSWSRFITDGDFESVAVIPGSAEDQVWVSVKRTMEGVNQGDAVRYIEYFNDRDFGSDVDDAYFVDCGITYDSDATTTITGLAHLQGESVGVLADGAIQTNKTVSSGQITITSASTVQAGMPFTVQLKTMPMSMAVQGASVMGRIQRINQVIPQYYNSGDFYVGRDTTDKELLSVSSMDSSDTDTDDRITFPPGYDRYGQIFIYQQSPEPLTLLGMWVEIGFN